LSCDQVLEDYVYAQLGGVNWYGFIRRYSGPEPFDLGLSLCCGEGAVERNLVRYGVCRACEGIDISPQALTYAREAARKAGVSTITYRIADVEKVKLEPERYDLAAGWMGLHHLKRLGPVFAQLKQGLRAKGIFVVNEYVGPARFQMPGLQAELINTWLQKLPEELRRTPSGEIRDVFLPPTVQQVIARDPSEAFSSDRILPELRRHFDIVAQVDYGGVLLQWVLADLTQNFDPENAEHRAWLQRLYEAEREVLRSGTLPSDFTFIIARKPEGERV
jgi:SAM-dependent methyltransferase